MVSASSGGLAVPRNIGYGGLRNRDLGLGQVLGFNASLGGLGVVMSSGLGF